MVKKISILILALSSFTFAGCVNEKTAKQEIISDESFDVENVDFYKGKAMESNQVIVETADMMYRENSTIFTFQKGESNVTKLKKTKTKAEYDKIKIKYVLEIGKKDLKEISTRYSEVIKNTLPIEE
ncbi:hypothetical protein ACQKMD_07550 [Viridibacillus sp. NPDC096237]|uniref:hypothetical protein n=1 Tax=Viridibacillus sp. NPDC096237 TaxID=3390721 RepID=UPI003D0872FE